MKKVIDKLKSLISNRIMMMFAAITVLFSVLLIRFYNLQVLRQGQNQEAIRAATIRKIPINAARGEIFDRFGRPLAVNKTAFCIKMDLSIPVRDLNQIAEEFLKVLDLNKEAYIDHLPITQSEPFTFTFSGKAAEKRWKKDMGLKEEQMDDTAPEIIDYLRKFFEIPSDYSSAEARKILAIRTEIFLQRYRQYQSVTLAENISPSTIAAIEEQPDKFSGLYIEPYAQRYYPEGENTSHILGYMGTINDDEFARLKSSGYTNEDLLGKAGIEKACENTLHGEKGEEMVEVDSQGKRINEIQTIASKKGQDVFLTVDSELQKKALQSLQENLKQVIVQKLDEGEITSDMLFSSLAESNLISIDKMMASDKDLVQKDIKNLVLSQMPAVNVQNPESVKQAKKVIKDAVNDKTLQPLQIVLCMIRQGTVGCSKEMLQSLENGRLSPFQFIRDKIAVGEIRPGDTNLDPCTGSAAVIDIHSGDTLALVSYPSYDNNKLVNHFDNVYYQKLLSDPATPLINRPLMERKAPGSVLKMLTAVAGLESGTINTHSIIQDEGVYQKAGKPYAKCLIYSRYGMTHGPIDVSKALEVSCNYFFYEVAYRMGNKTEGTTLHAIGILNDYMKKFGLDDYSGIEIEELKPKMASPEAKKTIVEALDEHATESQKKWMDGDSIRSAIGQSYNSFSVIHIAKYIMTLANGGTRYKINLIKDIKKDGEVNISETEPVIEEQINISPETLEAVYKGMLGVTKGSQGTLRKFFSDYPIEVAAKTGTAEEAKNRPSHTWFVGFAPYKDPLIAVVVMIPFGETKTGPATKVAKEIIAEYLQLYDKPEQKAVNDNAFVS